MRKLLLILATLALAVGLTTTFSNAPALAHNDFGNPSGYATCQEERVEWTASSSTTHSHLSYVDPGWRYMIWHCCLDLYGLSHRWNYSWRWWNDETSSTEWSPVYADWCP